MKNDTVIYMMQLHVFYLTYIRQKAYTNINIDKNLEFLMMMKLYMMKQHSKETHWI